MEQAVADGLVNKNTHPHYPLAIYNYTRDTMWNRKWNEITCFGRGAIYREDTGELIAAPFPKFFNLNEREETRYENLPKGEFIVEEKVNGYLALVFWNPFSKSLDTATKGSFQSDHAAFTRQLMNKYNIQWDGSRNVCFLFEGVHKEDPHIVEYDDEFLTLIGGYYEGYPKTDAGLWFEFEPDELDDLALQWGVPRPKIYSFDSVDSVIEAAKNAKADIEGYIVRWKDGFRLKLKGTGYNNKKFVVRKLSKQHLCDYFSLKTGEFNWQHEKILALEEEYRKIVIDFVAEIEREILAKARTLAVHGAKLRMAQSPQIFYNQKPEPQPYDKLAYGFKSSDLKQLPQPVLKWAINELRQKYKQERINLEAPDLF